MPPVTVTAKRLSTLTCAASVASSISIAGLFGLNNDHHPIANTFFGNTFSGLVDAGGALWNAHLGAAAGAYILGGAYQGLSPSNRFMGMNGRASSFAAKGIVGTISDAVLNSAYPDLAGPFCIAKLGIDGAIFLGSLAYCGTH